MIAMDTEIWQDAEGNPVPFGHASGVSVLYGAGTRVSEAEAARIAAALSSGKDVAAPADDKAVKGPGKRK